jgi:hypothetical protein
MNVSEQNHLKVLSIILIVLGTLSLPADLPYAVFVAIVFEFLGVLGYALAHYLADPTTATADLQSVTTAITSAITQAQQAKTTPQPQPAPKVDVAGLTAEITSMIPQIIEKYTSLAANPPTAAATPVPATQ